MLSNLVSQAIGNAKKKLHKRAKMYGLYENFGQEEVRKLQDRYNYNSLKYGTPKERRVADLLRQFEDWCINFNDTDI